MKKHILTNGSRLLLVLLLAYSCEKNISESPPMIPIPLGTVIIHSDPKGAIIYEDGRISGKKTPDTLNWLEEREYYFTLKKKYHNDTSFVLDASTDSSEKIFIDYYENLSMLGNVSLSSRPNSAEVYLNNEYIGTTPFSKAKIKPGEYYFVFKKENTRCDSILLPVYSSRTSKGEIKLSDTTYWVDYSVNTSGIHNNVITSVVVDQNDVVWVGSDFGVSSFDGRQWEYYSTENSGLIGMIINGIKVDQNNNIWFATNNGLSKYDGSVWTNESSFNSLSFPDDWVEDVEFMEDGRRIIATKNGIGISSEEGWEIIKFSDQASVLNWITDIDIRKDNDIWITHKSNGVQHFDGKNWNWFFPTSDNPYSISYRCVTIAEDAVWFGHKIHFYSSMTGLSSFKNNTFDKKSYSAFWGINVYNIRIKNSNEKWVASRDGLLVFDNYDNRKFYSTDNTPLKQSGIFDIAFDSKGDAWIATYGAGLYHYKVSQTK